jgi:deoxyxylulose-5-phosphate synthase
VRLARPIPLLQLGIPERHLGHGSRESCLAAAALDGAGICAAIDRWWTERDSEPKQAAGSGR